MSFKQNWLQRFEEAGAIWHFRDGHPHACYDMASKHAGFYFNTDIALSQPELVAAISEFFANICRQKKVAPDWVISYATTVSSTLVLAAKIAELLSAHFSYVDLHDDICRFQPQKGQSVLLITDDIHSGKSLDQMIGLVEKAGGQIIPFIFTMANFYNAPMFKDKKIISLFERRIETYSSDNCPMCKKGSLALNARRNWDKLMTGAPS